MFLKYRLTALCIFALLASSSVSFGQAGLGGGVPGSPGSLPGGMNPGGYPGMGSGMGMGMGSGMPAGPVKPQLVRRTVTETIMVPISQEELAEVQEYQAALAALRTEDRTPEQKTAAREALAKLVEKQFARDLENREKEVAELEARTKKLRQQFDKRKAAKAEIIALRLQTLQNEIDGLGFPADAGSASGVTFGGFGSTFLEPGSGSMVTGLGAPLPAKATDSLLPDEPEANLLKNPSFEDGPNQWGTGAPPKTVEYTIQSQQGVNNFAAARIHKTANNYFPVAEFTQEIVYDGKSPAIELSAMVKTKDARKAVLDVLFIDDKKEWIKHEWAAYIGDQSDDPQPLTHDFKEYKGTVAIPPNTKTIVIGLQDYGPGDVWFDEVKAVYRDQAPPSKPE